MNETKTKYFIRGGQVTLHNIRMFSQIINVVLMISLGTFVIFNIFWYYKTNSDYEQYVFKSWCWAKLVTNINEKSKQEHMTPSGIKYEALSQDILKSRNVRQTVDQVYSNAVMGFKISLFCYVLIASLAGYFIRKKGKSITDDKLLNSHNLVPIKTYKRLVKKQKLQSDLIIGGAPLIKESESKHIFLHGSTGSGKSTCIKELMARIIARGDKFIVLDKSCDLAATFYDENRHIILNPFDKRSKSWNVWADTRDSADLDSIAEALMPMPKGSQDPFWVNAARTIFTATVFQMRNDPEKSNIKLLRNLLTADLEKMEEFLANTEAATLVSEKIEKTAISIKSVLATYLKSIKYLQENNEIISIRNWVSDPKSQGIFITSLADKHPTLRPLISMWLDIAINATMSLTPDRQRRVWLILDEAHSLHRLPCLFEGVNEVRKFGGCFVLGTTSYAGICDLYGQDGARGILDQFNTSLYFRTPRAETALWVSKELGESEIEEMSENISYGANTIRDGISLSKHKVRKPAVPYTDIQKLEDLEAFLRVPGNFPITKVKFEIFKSNSIVNGYEPAVINEDIFKDICELEETYINNPLNAPEYKSKAGKVKIRQSVKNEKLNTKVALDNLSEVEAI